ncbi:DDB1- and CUL4-associated factor 5 isoform X2 [Periplaneta americana]|uniref:DDB1- and CUL4-associated factor 5 isoform X2 n=1 Tax=Periplaneta americana TaxID=6978 RepID=UPI0037E9A9EF
MARPSPANPLGYLVKRQYNDRLNINKQLLRERLYSARNLYRKDLLAHYGCVNAIEFSNKGELLASGGDDRRVLIWNVEQAVHGVGKPAAMRAQHISNIFCLGFDSTNSKIFSAGNDDQVIVHDAKTGDPLDYFLHEQPVYGLSIDPINDNVFASACDDGRVLIYDIREPVSTEPFCLASYTSAFHAVMFNPVESRILTTANSKEGVGLWDVRKPRQVVMRYGGQNASQSCMSVRFNQRGTQILALRRRLPPVLYAVHSPMHICQFDHAGYYNSCTMKSCCFAGEDDQYVLSGSDDFNLYVWQIPPSEIKAQWIDSAHMILKGHRSIVNQVRFNPSNYIIASSGVEKLIKFWSPFPLPESTGSLIHEMEPADKQRKVFTHEEYISLVLRSGQFMSHDYSHQSTKEDPRMMAFFDSLVQREIEGWSSEESVSSEVSATGYAETVQDPLPSPSSDSESIRSAPDQNAETERSEPVEAQNRISQLIARKRAQLMRLARTRSQGDDASETLRTKSKKRRDRKARMLMLGSGHSTDSSDSGREVAANKEDSVDSEDDVINDKVRRRLGSTLKKNSVGSYQNGKTGASSSSKPSKKIETKSSSDCRKRRMKYMLAFSESSDDESWKPSPKRKKLWNQTKSTETKSSDTDAVGASEVSGEMQSESEPQLNGGNENGQNKLIKKIKRLRKHRGKQNESENATVAEDSDSNSNTSSDSVWCRTKRSERRSSYHDRTTQSSSTSKAVKNGLVGKWNGKNRCDGHEKKLIETSSDSSDNGQENFNHKISLINKDNKVPISTSPEALAKLKIPYSRSFNYNNSVSKEQKDECDSSSSDVGNSNISNNNNNEYVNGSGAAVSPRCEISLSNPATPNMKQCNRSLLHIETPDSGIVIAPCSSAGSLESSSTFNSRPGSSSGIHHVESNSSHLVGSGATDNDGSDGPDWLILKQFKNRLNRARRNYRNHIGDSDSN